MYYICVFLGEKIVYYINNIVAYGFYFKENHARLLPNDYKKVWVSQMRVISTLNIFLFFCHPAAHGVPGAGIRSELQLWPAAAMAMWCSRDATNPVAP